ncbi:MAG TPA: hypothetical protein PK668_20985 [Myxococcota bacterium]|nr:hypothetical protein [Myxococcota bacterium]HRY96612.1 hypothetical protein [Myxococcota bacterium]
MLWLIPVGLVALFGGAAWWVSSEEQEARKRWHRKHREVQRSLEEHRQNVEENLARAESSHRFHFLRDLHHSSFRVADAAHGLLHDARTSITAVERILQHTWAEHDRRGESLRGLPRPERRAQLEAERAQMADLIDQLRADRDKLRAEAEHFEAEVARFNRTTRELKEAIRDRCGERGQEWYARLEARVAEKRRCQMGTARASLSMKAG